MVPMISPQEKELTQRLSLAAFPVQPPSPAQDTGLWIPSGSATRKNRVSMACQGWRGGKPKAHVHVGSFPRKTESVESINFQGPALDYVSLNAVRGAVGLQ